MNKYNTLISIAKKVREQLENNCIDHRFPRIKFDGSLNGLCNIASKRIFNLSKKQKIYPTFVVGCYRKNNKFVSNHCWIEYNKKIIDITATQFGAKNEIFVTDNNNENYKAYEKSSKNCHHSTDWLETYRIGKNNNNIFISDAMPK